MRLSLVLLAALAFALAAFASSTDTLAAAGGAHFFGHVTLFDLAAPSTSHVRARVAGEICADGNVDLAKLDGDSQSTSSYGLELPVACGAGGESVEFEWYRDGSVIAATCNPTGSLEVGDHRLDLICGTDAQFGATWIVTNNTAEKQRALEIFPRVVVGGVNVADAPVACGVPDVYAGSTWGSPVLMSHGEVVFPEPCVAPGESVRLGLSTDCPCQSELEIKRVVWLSAEPLFKANVDCDSDVDGADALLDLQIVAQTQTIDACPGNDDHIFPSALGGLWGDVNCDQQITALDAVSILRTTQQLPSGIDASCRATYGVYS